MSEYLDTGRLILRQFTDKDAELLIELDSDPAVMRYLSGGEPTAPEVIRERNLPNIIAGYERWGGDFGLFAAREKAGGAFVGWFFLRPERGGPLDEVELGYRLRRAAWGAGYATEGAKALLGKAFTELGVRTVWAETMTANSASRNVLEKVGMVLTEGAEHGGVRYEITSEQWRQRRPL
ncbi:GNAT family N-acetyltransferase [Actinoplanes sp. NPDC048796]|uniref:GNAT family N-acetyltransferase n=1 Tax=Actinoplanes sp. NPDC048796 TaxID=3155640 RepID=UPI00340D2DD1